MRIRSSSLSLSGVEDLLRENAELQRRVRQLERQQAAGAAAAQAAAAAPAPAPELQPDLHRAAGGREGIREHTQVRARATPGAATRAPLAPSALLRARPSLSCSAPPGFAAAAARRGRSRS